MSIYTKTGDTGETSLFGGKRVLKCDDLVDVYGSLDELNSWIGLILCHIKSAVIKNLLQKIQSDLFLAGSVLAGWRGDLDDLGRRVNEMEKMIDKMEKNLPRLTHFIIPGGTNLSSLVHITRSICRRVERQAVAFFNNHKSPNSKTIITYLNRLSDWLFMVARHNNKLEKVPDLIWSGNK